jgi:hypothetical protein
MCLLSESGERTREWARSGGVPTEKTSAAFRRYFITVGKKKERVREKNVTTSEAYKMNTHHVRVD